MKLADSFPWMTFTIAVIAVAAATTAGSSARGSTEPV